MKLWKKQGEDSPVEAGADRALPTTDDKGKKTTVILGEMQKGVQIPPSRFSITAEAERRR